MIFLPLSNIIITCIIMMRLFSVYMHNTLCHYESTMIMTCYICLGHKCKLVPPPPRKTTVQNSQCLFWVLVFFFGSYFAHKNTSVQSNYLPFHTITSKKQNKTKQKQKTKLLMSNKGLKKEVNMSTVPQTFSVPLEKQPIEHLTSGFMPFPTTLYRHSDWLMTAHSLITLC